ncbi:MAG: cobyrinate a,c-diamide synthase [Ignavibacteriaceae bacterium]
MVSGNYPRVIISGLSGDSGKTVVTCGLLACLKDRGINVSGFKKGPDYIDAAWLNLASGKPARNLDTYMMGSEKVKESFIKNACKDGYNIIEGNRGLFDGVDSKGVHSTSELARLLKSPVIIVQDISKVTRTAATSILGCKSLAPELNIAGVILNRVAGERHEKIVKEAIEDITGIPVIGAVPKLPGKLILPSRYLGLITPGEFEQKSILLRELENIIKNNIDVQKILNIAENAPPLEFDGSDFKKEQKKFISTNVKIGYFRDKAFSFYYPENLELLTREGAELIPISSTHNAYFDELDALYIGGGFPEMNLSYLTSNRGMIAAIKKMAEDGLPIYAECGGLMYLAREIMWKEKKYSLAGVLPVSIEMHDKPQGHGYCEMTVDKDNPFYNKGVVIKGHEFHYSKIFDYDPEIKSCLSVSRGCGCFHDRDGLTYKNVFASYLHVHALASPEWVKGMIRCAVNYKKSKNSQLIGIN